MGSRMPAAPRKAPGSAETWSRTSKRDGSKRGGGGAGLSVSKGGEGTKMRSTSVLDILLLSSLVLISMFVALK